MSEPYAVKMPKLSDTMTEGVLVSWKKQPGEPVKRGEIIAEVETDKAIMEVEVFRDGYLAGPLAAEGATVAVGEPIGYLTEEPAGSVSTAAAAPAPVAVNGEPGGAEPEGVVQAIKMPKLSDTMTEGVLVSWKKQPGEAVKRGDIIADVETDKAIMEVEVFRDGFLSGPLAAAGSTVAVGEVIAYLVEQAEQALAAVVETRATAALASSAAEAPAPLAPAQPQVDLGPWASSMHAEPAARPGRGKASPRARAVAAELGVDLDTVTGTGPEGEITEHDVRMTKPAVAPWGGFRAAEIEVPGEGRAMTSMERAVAQSMSASLTMPTFHVSVNVRPEALIAAAKARGVSVTVAIARAAALAIAKAPKINWAYQPQDKLIERAEVHIGMAVASDDGGLVVPVLRSAEARGLEALNESWKGLVDRARKRKLKPEEYSGSTLQISNMGMFGVSQFDAIVTPGIASILAIAANGPEGMPITATCDHRVVNGMDAALYLGELKRLIENPAEWVGSGAAADLKTAVQPMRVDTASTQVPATAPLAAAHAGPAIPAGEWDFDVAIIGGGPGGEDCARDLVQHGLKVVLVNDAPFPGGECLWRGCIPSKTWRAAADRMRDRAGDARLGVEGTAGEIRLNWSQLEATRREVLEGRGQMALNTDKGVKITVKQGFARFAGPHELAIDTGGNSADPHRRALPGDGSQVERLRFGAAVIATGAPPFVPPIPGALDGVTSGLVLTSDTVWNLPEPPRRLLVIGGGAIGCEMAQMFADFGAEVTLLEVRDRILFEVEPEVARELTAVLNAEERLSVHTGVKVEMIEGTPMAGSVRYLPAGASEAVTVACDYVLMATGKRPVLAPLNLAAAGVKDDGRVIPVDAQCRTNVPHVFAVGDVNGGYMLAHTAAQQGRVAATTLTGEGGLAYDQNLDCGVIFCRPQAGFVGLSVEQAKAQGIEAVEAKMPIKIDAKAMIQGETHGFIKLVADAASERIVGVHMLADHVDTLIGEGVMMVAGQLTLTQVANAIHPHPTQTELFGELARRLRARIRRSRK